MLARAAAGVALAGRGTVSNDKRAGTAAGAPGGGPSSTDALSVEAWRRPATGRRSWPVTQTERTELHRKSARRTTPTSAAREEDRGQTTACGRRRRPTREKPRPPASSNRAAQLRTPRIRPRCSDKSKDEEQILRCANRLKPHLTAVDALRAVLLGVRDKLCAESFRKIDRTNVNNAYAARTKDRPDAEDLLPVTN